MYLPHLLLVPYNLQEPSLPLPIGIGDVIFNWISYILNLAKEAGSAILTWIPVLLPKIGHFIKECGELALQWILMVRNEKVDPLMEMHPRLALFICLLIGIGPEILMLALILLQGAVLGVLAIIGFGAAGITGGSSAACFQSIVYAGAIPAGSLFATLQSIGAGYQFVTFTPPIIFIMIPVRAIAAVLAVYDVLYFLH